MKSRYSFCTLIKFRYLETQFREITCHQYFTVLAVLYVYCYFIIIIAKIRKGPAGRKTVRLTVGQIQLRELFDGTRTEAQQVKIDSCAPSKHTALCSALILNSIE